MGSEVWSSRLVASDLTLLHGWLNEAHLKPFYMQEPISLAEIVQKFTPRLGKDHAVRCFLVHDAEGPFGYCQIYRTLSFPEWAREYQLPQGIALDYFIGKVAALGRGLGAAMLREICNHRAHQMFSDENCCVMYHDPDNRRAIRTTTAANFSLVRSVSVKSKIYDVFVRPRNTPRSEHLT